MPSRHELLATGRSDEEICREVGADALVYQDLGSLVRDVNLSNPEIENFDCSCFDGKYVTGDVTESYLAAIEMARRDGEKFRKPANSSTQLDLNLVGAEEEEAT
jgi:amidophosphoribosyltransferase